MPQSWRQLKREMGPHPRKVTKGKLQIEFPSVKIKC